MNLNSVPVNNHYIDSEIFRIYNKKMGTCADKDQIAQHRRYLKSSDKEQVASFQEDFKEIKLQVCEQNPTADTSFEQTENKVIKSYHLQPVSKSPNQQRVKDSQGISFGKVLDSLNKAVGFMTVAPLFCDRQPIRKYPQTIQRKNKY